MNEPLNHSTRERLVEACVSDYANTLASDQTFREETARQGFSGFKGLSDTDLIQAWRDAGLDEQDAALAEAVARADDGRADDD